MTTEYIVPYALTSLQRVKDIANITVTTQDSVLIRYINSVSDFIQNYCRRNFLQQTYFLELHDIYQHRQAHLMLRNTPVFYLPITANTTINSNQITNCSSTAGISIGMAISGDGVAPAPGGTPITITAIDAVNKILTISANASLTGVANLIVNGLYQFQWRAGTVSNPFWTNFIVDQYELEEDGKSGIIRVYGGMPHGSNMVRVSYVAGYLIDFTNVGDITKHNLPFDLSAAAERLVAKMYYRRQKIALKSETFQGATINWATVMDDQDKQTLDNYTKILFA